MRDIDLNIPAGQTVALLGANGAGKTTLLRVLSTLTQCSDGDLELFGHHVGAITTKLRSRIGLIAHQPMLYRDLSGRENLEFFGQLYGIDAPRPRAEELLKQVGLINRADDAVKQLSRGMVQRLSIARALMHDPDLLLADEPFDGLDASSAEAFEKYLGQLRTEGKTIVLANHDIAQSLRLADSIVMLRSGRVVLDGPADQFSAESLIEEIAAS